jgi:hypothetical protein
MSARRQIAFVRRYIVARPALAMQHLQLGFTITHGGSMLNRAHNQTLPALPQTDVADLAERITALRERIVVMVHEGRQTRDQSELLFCLLRALRAAKAPRAPGPERLFTAGTMHRPAQSLTGACRRHAVAGADSATTATGPHAGHGRHDGR